MPDSFDLDRRTLLKVAAASLLSTPLLRAAGPALKEDAGFIDVRQTPDAVWIITEDGQVEAAKAAPGRWQSPGVEVTTAPGADALRVSLNAPRAAVKQILLRWRRSTVSWKQTLGDHWERSYGDLRWRDAADPRPSPWYLLAHTAAGATHAVGVRTQPNAFCSWQHDVDGVTLTCDVRAGGVGVQLGSRTLAVCDVIARPGSNDESPFAAATAFCRQMCPKPRMADHNVYGFNDWYYAYGHNTPAGLLADAELLSAVATSKTNRPYCVIDDGWQTLTKVPDGQWSATRPTFGSMSDLAASMRKLDVRPGIWMRPLIDDIHAWPEGLHLSHNKNILDPTIPDAKQIVAADVARLRGWGYDLIKHDFTTFDVTGNWGKDMGHTVTRDGWSFASRERTTAEVINDLYAAIRQAAGPTIIIGCNTVSHLTAGVFELNRIGDDTSGNDWHRNPQMGVNTLAFRAPHQNAFYGADADCCPITTRLEWRKAKQWLDLVSCSGTPLFVSAERKAVTPEIRQALEQAFTAAAAAPAPVAEPLDWMTSATPRQWNLNGQHVTYDWS